MLGISQYYQIERDLVTGLVILAAMVLLRSMFTRRGRLSTEPDSVYQDIDDEDVLHDENGLNIHPDSDLGRATSGPL